MDTPVELVALVGLGVVAGALTTVSGMGGGLLVVFALSWLLGPKAALAVSAAALLCGNLHRAVLYRGAAPRAVLRPVLAGLVPGALVGALVTGGLPDAALRALMVAVALVAVIRHFTFAGWRVPRAWLVPAGLGVGAVAATAGGAGVLLGPVLLSAGLAGDRYLAAVAVSSVALHGVRVIGYASVGLLGVAQLPTVAVLAAAILAGNLAGRRLRTWIPDRVATSIETATPLVCAALAAAGLG
ncbi:MAG TPA: sulfite exporter TauE/SafE family protein [Kofleriaceae bacterium]|jgi:uncharacterized membrane protein YfcA|nr:sulfite exporter TauE/SafE family protein [Kofleriaceae bacterium]